MIKKIVLFIIKIYQKTLSPDHGIFSFWLKNKFCRFYPTCSNYTHEAIEKFGARKGLTVAIKRILRCHPFSAGGYDPVEHLSES